MHFDVHSRTILYVRHGSWAYGLNTPSSDEDFKGVCIKPKQCYLGFMQKFEQHESMKSKDNDVDSVIFSLDKFANLAADCNPNIIEILHVSNEDVLKIDKFGEKLRSIKDEFLSKKAKFTFSGYAIAQLKRIKTHRAWLLTPPKSMPERKNFGLSETMKVSQSDLGALDAAVKSGITIEMPKDIITLFTREKQYQAAKTQWDQYTNWTKTRNSARAELEAKHGYDTKHGMHLVRLMTMCKEILTTGRVIVKRHDKEELLAIRNGAWSYDRLIDYAEKLDLECDELYKTSNVLPKEPNREKLDNVVIEMTEEYLREHG